MSKLKTHKMPRWQLSGDTMEIKEMKKITDQHHLNLFALAYLDRTGRQKSWVFASRKEVPEVVDNNPPAPDAVVVAALHEATDELVLIREFRVALGGFQYGFPAGLVDSGETVETAAARELKEETGLLLDTVERVSPPIYSSSGMTDESISLVVGRCRGTISLAGNEASEEISVLRLSRQEARTLLETPALKFDVKSWILLDVFARTGAL